MKEYIQVENLSFSYQNKIPVFDGTNICLKKGRSYLLTGDNGAGKTTLMRLMAGLITDGQACDIKWFDEKVDNFNQLKDRILYLKETPYLYDYLTGAENIDLLVEVLEVKDKDKVYDNLKTYCLDQELNKLVKEYSLGMRYKLFLCVVFAMEIQLILFDEPFSSLDAMAPKNAETMLNDFVEHGGIALIATHIEEYQQKYMRFQYRIEKGKLVYYEY